MASLTQKKAEALNVLVSISAKAEAASRDLTEVHAYFGDNGFLTGGANPIVDGDCVDSNAHLTAALVNGALAAILTMKLSNANLTTLRQVARTSLLPQS